MAKAISHRHRAEVIEVYENGSRAAVRFASGRIECVNRRGFSPDFKVAQRGTVDFVRSLNGFEWIFTPSK